MSQPKKLKHKGNLKVDLCYIITILKRFRKLLESMNCVPGVEKNLGKMKMIVLTDHTLGLGVDVFDY